MKLKLYRILFNIVSFLTNLTKGYCSLLVNYKLFIGSLIIGLTSVSCSNKKMQVVCYDIAVSHINTEDSISEIVEVPYCYMPAINDKIEPDSIKIEP